MGWIGRIVIAVIAAVICYIVCYVLVIFLPGLPPIGPQVAVRVLSVGVPVLPVRGLPHRPVERSQTLAERPLDPAAVLTDPPAQDQTEPAGEAVGACHRGLVALHELAGDLERLVASGITQR
jgi:hypothetical protein